MTEVPLAGLFVLVVEDEFLIGLGLSTAFLDAGAVCPEPVASVAAAFEILESVTPDFCVLDVRVNDGTTFKFAKALHERGIPFVFASGNSETLTPDELVGVPLIGKPYDERKIVRLASMMCERG